MCCGGGVTRGSGSVERKEAGRGAAALEREIYLFKEQGSIFFLNWNSYNAPYIYSPYWTCIPNNLSRSPYKFGLIFSKQISTYYSYSFPKYLYFSKLPRTRDEEEVEGRRPPCCAFLCRAQEARGLGRRHVPGCYWPAWPAMGDSLWERDIYRLDSFARCSLYVLRL